MFGDLQLPRKKLLFLHGWSSNGGRKAMYLWSLGYDVRRPKLPSLSFRRAVQMAQQDQDEFRPDVIVGSSRGAAVAMSLENNQTPLVLLAPAWRFFGVEPRLRSTNAVVIHSPHDRLVPILDSVKLCRRNPGAHLVEAGEGHRLNDLDARRALKDALAMLTHWPTDQARTKSF